MVDEYHIIEHVGTGERYVTAYRLAQMALSEAGEEAHALFKGPVAIAYGPDPVSAAKATTAFAKDNEKLAETLAAFVTLAAIQFGIGCPSVTL